MKVLVIGGGISDEREVALRSSKAVTESAKKAGHETEHYDWDGSYDWLDQNVGSFDVVLPILHGKGGEDGQIQKYLEQKNVKFLGSGSESSKNCFDKQLTREILAKSNILVPEGGLVDLRQYEASFLSTRPHVLKPVDGGSSIDTLMNITIDKVERSEIEELFSRHGKMLIEEFIEGSEVTMPVLDGRDLPVIEIIPPYGQAFDYENKYNGKTDELCPPKNIDPSMQKKLQDLAQKTHKIMGCRHLSRVDVMISQGTPYVIEINTMPGMTDASLFPLAAQQTGMDMPRLVDYLISLAANP